MTTISLTLRLLTVSTILLKKTTIHTINSNRNTINSAYDFIVVGAGTAGGVVANRLAENPNIMVLLLEAGPANSVDSDIPGLRSSLYTSEYVWNYTEVKQFVGQAYADRRIIDHKGRVLGGTSSINGMVYIRGNRRTFDEWAQVYGADGWSYGEVLPYFKKFENNTDGAIVANGYHGKEGPVQITSCPATTEPMALILEKAMEEMAVKNTDINGPKQSGASIAQAFISEDGVRQSTANTYLDPNPYPKNLHIMSRALVTKVLFDARGQAFGVEFYRHGKRFTVGARMEVIVSAGSVNSPQLLMLSGIGPRAQLTSFGIPVLSDVPVGEHYQHHPRLTIDVFIKNSYNELIYTKQSAPTIDNLYEYYTQHTGALRGGYNPMIYFNTDRNDVKDFPNGFIRFYIVLSTPVDGSSYEHREAWRQYYATNNSTYKFDVSAALQRIRSYGYVRLQSSDPFVQPFMNSKFLTDSQDFEDMKRVVEFMFYFFERSSIAAYVIPHRPIPECSFCPNQTHVYECASYIRCLIRQLITSTCHTVGSCRMGAANRPDTVVDPRLRVKGVNRLRVCDASVMPTITNGATNAPTLMIGEKCADLVKEDNHLMGTSLKLKLI